MSSPLSNEELKARIKRAHYGLELAERQALEDPYPQNRAATHNAVKAMQDIADVLLELVRRYELTAVAEALHEAYRTAPEEEVSNDGNNPSHGHG